MCVSVCLSVTTFSAITCNELAKEQFQKVQRYTCLFLRNTSFLTVTVQKKQVNKSKIWKLMRFLHVFCVLLWSCFIFICMIPSLFLLPPLLSANISQLCSVEVHSATHRPSTWGFLCSCNDVRMMSCHYVHLNQPEIVVSMSWHYFIRHRVCMYVLRFSEITLVHVNQFQGSYICANHNSL